MLAIEPRFTAGGNDAYREARRRVPLEKASEVAEAAAEGALVVMLALALLVFVDAVDADRDRDDQRVVDALLDLDPVGVPDPEPLARDPADDPVAVLQLPVLVGEAADGLEPRPVEEVDLVPVVNRREERRADGRHDALAVLDLHRVAHREELLADEDEQVAVGVLELERLAEAERPAVDEEDAVAALVLNPEVSPQGEDPFLDQVSHDKKSYARFPLGSVDVDAPPSRVGGDDAARDHRQAAALGG